MQVGMIKGHTRILGKSQGYRGLPVRDEVDDGVPQMVTVWHPGPNDVAAIQAGASIYLRILGTKHPPVIITVGDAPEQLQEQTQ